MPLPFLWSGRAMWVCQRAAKQGPKQPKTAFFGQKRIWWFQTGGTVWNKGGTSQGTSPVMHWNRFSGQGGPSGCARGLPNRVQNSQKRPFWAISGSGGSKLVEQSETRVEQVRAHPLCIGTVLGVREGHMGVPEGLQRGPKLPKTAFLGHKRIWWLQTGGTKWNKGGTSQGTSPVMHWNRFWDQGCPWGAPGATRSAYGPKRLFLAVLDLFGGPLAHPYGPP